MTRVTYLLGAGASFPVIPIVAKINEDLKDFGREIHSEIIKAFNRNPKSLDKKYSQPFDKYGEIIKKEIDKIGLDLGNHQSIDIYAKKLFIQEEKGKLKNLKKVLSMYFVYKQFTQPPQIRYDSFIAALINKSKNFPKHVNVLTWNYDIQLELAYCKFINTDNLLTAQERLAVCPPVPMEEKQDRFSVFKLNGTAMTVDENDRLVNPCNGSISTGMQIDDLIHHIIEIYLRNSNETDVNVSGIKYAWEEESRHRASMKGAKENTRDTKILVVIGYSFPFFNRSIDQALINNMPLEKVYIQSHPDTIDDVVSSFQSIRVFEKDKIIPIKSVNQFFLPPELTL